MTKEERAVKIELLEEIEADIMREHATYKEAYDNLSTTVVVVWKLAIGKLRNYQTPLPADRFLKPSFY